MLDLKRLRVLREVAERGSFSAAADSLYVSQSAISQQIAALEAEVGAQLLLRLRTGPILTDAGALLVSHADAAIARLDQAERELSELSGMHSGELRMISFASATATVITRAASRFRKVHPEIQLSLSEADPEDSIPRLKRGEFDLALVYDFELYPFEPDNDLALVHLLDEEMHVALSRDHPLADRESIPLDLLSEEIWLCGTGEGSCRQLTFRSCERAGFEPKIAFESDDYTVMQALVAAGMGVTLLPDLALLMRNPDIAVVDVEPETPVRRVWATTLEVGSRSPAAGEMVETLREVSVELLPQARLAASA